MTPKQIELVQTTWKSVSAISDTAAELFYGRLFELDPALKTLFKGDMRDQGKKLMMMIGTAVAGLKDLGALVPAVQALGVRHGGYGVKPEHYDTVGTALVWTLGKGLGDAFTDEVKAAWIETYTTLATVMKQAAYGTEAGKA
jgi:hemoglobin-like flavoprotein